jgi:hypothetical protein
VDPVYVRSLRCSYLIAHLLVDAAEALQPRVASGSTGAAGTLKVRGPWCDTRVANEDKRRFMKKRTVESAQCRAHFDAVAVLVALGMQPNHQHINTQISSSTPKTLCISRLRGALNIAPWGSATQRKPITAPLRDHANSQGKNPPNPHISPHVLICSQRTAPTCKNERCTLFFYWQ